MTTFSNLILQTLHQGVNASRNNPLAAAAMGTGLLVTGVPGIVAAPALSALGFGALGPMAGSIATVAQSIAGNVVAGSAFATMQSAGMGGAGAAVVNSAVSGAGALLASGGGFSFWKSGKGTGDEDGEDGKDGKEDGKDGEDGKEDGKDGNGQTRSADETVIMCCRLCSETV